MDNDVEHLFICLFATCISEISVLVLCSFSDFESTLYILDLRSVCQLCGSQIASICNLSFHALTKAFYKVKGFCFD